VFSESLSGILAISFICGEIALIVTERGDEGVVKIN
jgi:hypothetical protein